MTVTGLVLAAGAGSRLGTPKAEIVLNGERLIDRAVRVVRAAGCDHVLAVVRDGTVLDGADLVVVNPDPDRGMGSSLRLGLAAAAGDRALVMLVDTPGVGVDAVRTVLGCGAPVCIATYDGRRGHPVTFARDLWDEVAERATGDRGARGFLQAHPELVVEVPCAGDPADLDTAADLARWRRGPAATRPSPMI